MTNEKIRVAVNGYGVIGKRVADAVRLQPDMELVGVGDVVTDYRVQAGAVLGLPIYASLPEKADEMKAAGIPVIGTLDDLLARVEVVVDCTPKGIGAKNLERYRRCWRQGHLPGRRKTQPDRPLLCGPGQLRNRPEPGGNPRRFLQHHQYRAHVDRPAERRPAQKGAWRLNPPGDRPLGIGSQRHYEYGRAGGRHSQPPGAGCANRRPGPRCGDHCGQSRPHPDA